MRIPVSGISILEPWASAPEGGTISRHANVDVMARFAADSTGVTALGVRVSKTFILVKTVIGEGFQEVDQILFLLRR